MKNLRILLIAIMIIVIVVFINFEPSDEAKLVISTLTHDEDWEANHYRGIKSKKRNLEITYEGNIRNYEGYSNLYSFGVIDKWFIMNKVNELRKELTLKKFH